MWITAWALGDKEEFSQQHASHMHNNSQAMRYKIVPGMAYELVKM